MVDYILPDEAVEELICHSCFKYLSVKPVKVYPNRHIKCGRCSQDGDGGTVSLFRIVAEQILFKCVNSLDGCRQLLQYSHVVDHELVCKSEKYKCPQCAEPRELPTFLLIKHFRENHASQLLEQTYFVLDLNKSSENQKTFLYEDKDHLFFVTLEVESTNIFLDIFQLRERLKSTKIKKAFTLHSLDGIIIKTEERECNTFHSFTKESYKIGVADIASRVFFVEFHLKFCDSGKLIKLEYLENIHSVKSIIDPSANIEKVQLSLQGDVFARFMSTTPMYSEKSMNWPRKINISKKDRETYPECSLNSDFTSLVLSTAGNEKLDIFLNCVNCAQTYNAYYLNNNESVGWFVKNNNQFYAICYFCHQYYKQIRDNIFVPEKIIAYIPTRFYCLWGCVFENFRTLNHEKYCGYQPNRRCPLKECLYEGKLCGMKDHFEDIHKAPWSYYSTFSISFHDEIHGNEYYIWVPSHFVVLKWKLLESQFELTLSMSEENDRLSVTPQALIFTSPTDIKMMRANQFICENLEFMCILEENKSIIVDLPSNLLIKCYLKTLE